MTSRESGVGDEHRSPHRGHHAHRAPEAGVPSEVVPGSHPHSVSAGGELPGHVIHQPPRGESSEPKNAKPNTPVKINSLMSVKRALPETTPPPLRTTYSATGNAPSMTRLRVPQPRHTPRTRRPAPHSFDRSNLGVWCACLHCPVRQQSPVEPLTPGSPLAVPELGLTVLS